MQLSPNFSLEELTASDTAAQNGIDNTPTSAVLANLSVLASGLEAVRALLGNLPIHINSGYRCPELNKLVGGESNSAHMDGFAADILCPQFGTPLAIVQFIAKSHLDFDQIIQEGTWVHCSFAPALRGMTMTAHFGPGGTTYSNGIDAA